MLKDQLVEANAQLADASVQDAVAQAQHEPIALLKQPPLQLSLASLTGEDTAESLQDMFDSSGERSVKSCVMSRISGSMALPVLAFPKDAELEEHVPGLRVVVLVHPVGEVVHHHLALVRVDVLSRGEER